MNETFNFGDLVCPASGGPVFGFVCGHPKQQSPEGTLVYIRWYGEGAAHRGGLTQNWGRDGALECMADLKLLVKAKNESARI